MTDSPLVLVSWSGSKSEKAAVAIRTWLREVIQAIEPWTSNEDIQAGARWIHELSAILERCSFGILCITRENQSSPWVMFEAGAVSKSIGSAFVCPYLIDLSPADLRNGPISQFQAKKADKKGTYELVLSINASLGESALDKDLLTRVFERAWPDLEVELETIAAFDEFEEGPVRSDREILEELLDLSRTMVRKPRINIFRNDTSLRSPTIVRLNDSDAEHYAVDVLTPTTPEIVLCQNCGVPIETNEAACSHCGTPKEPSDV